MRCVNGHDNVDLELFCCECKEIMPPLGHSTLMRIRWLAEPDPPTRSPARVPAPPPTRLESGDDASGDDAGELTLTRAELRRRRHSWPRRLRVRSSGFRSA
jgi:hypothetical protein